MDNLPHNIRVMNKQVIRTFKRLNKCTHYIGSNVPLDVSTLTSFKKSNVQTNHYNQPQGKPGDLPNVAQNTK
jgi:hypothetical protein